MSYRTLMFLEYGMTNAINYKCAFACDSKPKRGNTIDIVGAYHEEATTRHSNNIYLNNNKCNTLTEDGAIKKIWS